MKLIETKTLGTAAALVTFTSVPQDATDLVILMSARTSLAAVDETAYLYFDSGSSLTFRALTGTGSAANSSNGADIVWVANGGNSTASTFGNTIAYVPNYTAATNKSVSIDSVAETNGSVIRSAIFAGLYPHTGAITTVNILSAVSTFVAGSTFSLYKITKGSDGITTAS
jgi:hypothetical protein